MRDIHLVSTDSGIAFVTRVPGPYSDSAPIDTVVFELTADEYERTVAEYTVPPPRKPRKGEK